ncbi:MmgE/PrpD family protein [Fredinandcohnia sp. 179-A 10B2 NHS]|uniref:MmgE/PrpD family protein n=1 Tax=Fredinandcohnia sp. 179-A 10B2 NHS TaxID=3235176 RepID=UPI0039A1F6CC
MKTETKKSQTLALAQKVANTRFEDLPAEVIHEAKRRIADVIGIGLSGSTSIAGKKITEFSLNKGGSGKTTLWGSNVSTTPEFAALANGTMTFHMELDDVHRTSHTHPGVTVIPAALALCEEHGLSGKDLLLATVLGYDVEIRVGLAVSPSIYVDRTYLAPGTLGIFGATAATAKLLNFNVEKTAGALGTASYIGPLAPFESFRLGAPAKDTIMGWANYSGIYATLLSDVGFDGPESAMEGDFGYYKTVANKFDGDRIYNGLSDGFEIMNTGIKPYACCRQHHTAIDAVLELREKHNLVPEDIEKITHRTFVVGARGTEKCPTSIPAAKYSAPYTIAVALTYGRAWRDEYSQEQIKNLRLIELASKVEVLADQELDALYDEKWPSIIEITTKKKDVLVARYDLPKGEPENPVSDEELKEKFMSLTTDLFSSDHAESIWDKIFKVDQLEDISELTNLLKA